MEGTFKIYLAGKIDESYPSPACRSLLGGERKHLVHREKPPFFLFFQWKKTLLRSDIFDAITDSTHTSSRGTEASGCRHNFNTHWTTVVWPQARSLKPGKTDSGVALQMSSGGKGIVRLCTQAVPMSQESWLKPQREDYRKGCFIELCDIYGDTEVDKWKWE